MRNPKVRHFAISGWFGVSATGVGAGGGQCGELSSEPEALDPTSGPCSRDAALATIEAYSDMVFAFESRQAQHEVIDPSSEVRVRECQCSECSECPEHCIEEDGDPTDLLQVEQAQSGGGRAPPLKRLLGSKLLPQ